MASISLTIIGLSQPETNYNLLIKIDEIDIDNSINNDNLRDCILISNSSNNGILNINLNKYIGSINNNIEFLTITLLNQDMRMIDNGEGNVFNTSNMKNRFIMELSINPSY